MSMYCSLNVKDINDGIFMYEIGEKGSKARQFQKLNSRYIDNTEYIYYM